MLGKRTISIGLNKPAADEEELSFADKATIAGVCVEGVVKKVGFAIAGYVLLDTLRKVIIIKTMNGVGVE